MRTIKKFEKVFNYNRACEMLRKMMIDINEIKFSPNHVRSKYYDSLGNIVAEYNETKETLLVYNYNTHSDLVGKELRFN